MFSCEVLVKHGLLLFNSSPASMMRHNEQPFELISILLFEGSLYIDFVHFLSQLWLVSDISWAHFPLARTNVDEALFLFSHFTKNQSERTLELHLRCNRETFLPKLSLSPNEFRMTIFVGARSVRHLESQPNSEDTTEKGLKQHDMFRLTKGTKMKDIKEIKNSN